MRRDYSKDPVYVVVTHKLSGRSFALQRNYCLITDFYEMTSEDIENVCQEWDGWAPTARQQHPDWSWIIMEMDGESAFKSVWIETKGERK